jgi:hypothetical protein
MWSPFRCINSSQFILAIVLFMFFWTCGSGCGNAESGPRATKDFHSTKGSNIKPIAVVPGLDGKKEEKGSSQYHLLVAVTGRDETDFDNDTELAYGTGSLGGEVTIYVNDSPIRHMRESSGIPISGSIIPIYDLLEPGKNRIRVEGKHATRVFIKVVDLDMEKLKNTPRPFVGFRYEKMVAKKMLDPSQASSELEFTLPLTRSPDYEELPPDPKARVEERKDIHELLDEFIAACDGHDGDKCFSLLLPELKSPPRHRKNVEDAKKDWRTVYNIIKEPQYRLVTKREDVKMIFGRRTVLLYVDIGNVEDEPHLLRFDPLGNVQAGALPNPVFYLGEIALVRLGGKWMIR